MQVNAVVPVPRDGVNNFHPVCEEPASETVARVCGREGCSRPASERRSATGRRPGYCSAECRKGAVRARAAARRSAARAGRQPRAAVAARGETRFGKLLSTAMAETGLTLEEMSTRLRVEHGVHVSPSAISNWTHGRLPRRTTDDRQRTEAMEQLLRRPAGQIRFVLERDRADRRRGPTPATPGRRSNGEEDPVRDLRERMRELGGSDAYAVTAVEERVLIGEHRREYRRTVRVTLRALDAHTDCYRLVYSPDDGRARSEIVARRGCRKGREVRGTAGLSGIELLFDRVLDKGASYTFDYQELVEHAGPPQCWVRRGVGHSSVDVIRTVVWFAVPPARVWTCRWDKRGERPIDPVPVELVDNAATLNLEHPPAGLHGLTWEW